MDITIDMAYLHHISVNYFGDTAEFNVLTYHFMDSSGKEVGTVKTYNEKDEVISRLLLAAPLRVQEIVQPVEEIKDEISF